MHKSHRFDIKKSKNFLESPLPRPHPQWGGEYLLPIPHPGASILAPSAPRLSTPPLKISGYATVTEQFNLLKKHIDYV